MDYTIDSDQLRGFISERALADHVGATDHAEKSAAKAGLHVSEFYVVSASDIAAVRTDDAEADERVFLTFDEARAVLPEEYQPFERFGKEYPAAKKPKGTWIKGYTTDQVARAAEQRAAYRADLAARIAARVAERRSLLDRWTQGDEDVRLTVSIKERGEWIESGM